MDLPLDDYDTTFRYDYIIYIRFYGMLGFSENLLCRTI